VDRWFDRGDRPLSHRRRHLTPTATPRLNAVARIVRFDAVQRASHWINALLFGILMATALPLYFGSIAGIVVPRALVEEIHLWAGIALPVPLLIAIFGPWGVRFRRDLQRINVWSRDEVTWVKSLGRRAPQVVDKFNPGQKLNAIFTGAAIVVMLATGAMLKWFRYFPVDWRTGATFVHDVFALAVFVVVTGHVLFALTHPESLRSIVTGWVTKAWAARHAPGWLAEEEARAKP
jgi:formate dehydrogenase subunit gamma